MTRWVPFLSCALLTIACSGSSSGGGGGGSSNTSTEPAFYTTPTVNGVGQRTVNLSPGGGTTLSAALNGAQAGDDIVLAAGTYNGFGGNLRIVNSGTAQSWIRIRGAAGARPVIDLQGNGEFNIAASFVVLEHVEIINGGGNNVHVAPTTQSITDIIVRDCVVRSLSSGPGAAIKINRNNANNAGVERVYIEDNDLSESISNAIVDGVGVKQAVTRNNDIHDNAVGSHGLFFKGGSSEILIENNLIRGIRQNAALQLGGNTGAGFFDPAFANQEGVDQVARNNFIVDCDDSVFEIRGVLRGKIYNNTVITQSGFAVVRLSFGQTDAGGQSGNDAIEVVNNLIILTGGNPQYARNDGNAGQFTFGPQLWGGDVRNSSSAGAGVPSFPQTGDVVVPAAMTGSVLVNTSFAGLTGLSDALSRYRPVPSSPALSQGSPNAVAPRDVIGQSRSNTPSLGAFERP